MSASPEDFRKDFDAALGRRDFEAAANIIKVGLEAHPQDIWLNYRLFHLTEVRDGPEAALPCAQAFVDRFPNISTAHEALIRSLTQTGRTELAEEQAAIALERFPDDIWVKAADASIAQKKADWSTAAAKWRAILLAHPDFQPAYEFEIAALGHLNDPSTELRAGQYAQLWPDVKSFATIWADTPLKRQNPFAAAQRWALLARARRHWTEAAYRAASLFRSCDSVGNAVELLQDCVPADAKRDTTIFDLQMRGLCYRQARRAYEAQGFPHTVDRLAQLIVSTTRSAEMRRAIDASPPAAVSALSPEILKKVDNVAVLSPLQISCLLSASPDLAGSAAFAAVANDRSPPTVTQHHEIHRIRDLVAVAGHPLAEMAADLRALLRELNAFEFDRRVRAYQHQLYTDGRLALDESCLAGYRAIGSARVLHTAIAICLTNGTDRVWLASTSHGHAHDLGFVYVGALATFFVSDRHDDGEAQELRRLVLGFEAELDEGRHGSWQTIGEAAPLLLIGHNNFAHFIWNELPALCELEKLSPASNLTAAVLSEPFGDLHFKFPSSEPLPTHQFAEGVVCFYGSAKVVTAEARQRTVDACRMTGSDQLDPRIPDGPVVWVSLRLMYRHAVNQAPFVKALCAELEKWDQRPTIVLDGFSLPVDLEVPGRHRVDYLQGQQRAVCELARTIMSENQSAITIIDATHLDIVRISALIAETGERDEVFYVSSLGTQQHKLAWVTDIAGIIHASREMTGPAPSTAWQQTQADTLMEAIAVPAALMADAVTDNERQDRREFRDYSFEDPNAAAAWVANELSLLRQRQIVLRQIADGAV